MGFGHAFLALVILQVYHLGAAQGGLAAATAESGAAGRLCMHAVMIVACSLWSFGTSYSCKYPGN